MTPEEFYTTVLTPALNKVAKFAPEMPRDRSVEVLMTAISGQEANWTERSQHPGGEAHGLFQCQLNNIEDIIANPASAEFFKLAMKEFGINTTTAEHIFDILATPEGDVLAAVMARLNLWCDPNPIPPADEQQSLWQCYLRTWRPGAPNLKRWEVVYGQALSAVPC